MDLPSSSKIHPVFHVSKLKKKLGDVIQPQGQLPPLAEDGSLHLLPEVVLARRLVKRGNAADVEVLIQWHGAPESDATWEQFKSIEEKFPDVNLVDKVFLRGKDCYSSFFCILSSAVLGTFQVEPYSVTGPLE